MTSFETLFSNELKPDFDAHDFNNIPTGLWALDRITKGWKPGELTLLCAYAGNGRLGFINTILHSCGLLFHRRVGMFSSEQTFENVFWKMVANDRNESPERCQNMVAEDQFFEPIASSVDKVSKAPILFSFETKIPFKEFKIKVQMAVELAGVELILVDAISSIRLDEEGIYGECEEADILKKLKSLASDLDVSIVIGMELSHNETDLKDPKPQLNQIPGFIQIPVDKILLLFRPSFYGLRKSSEMDLVEVRVVKNNSGITGVGFFKFHFENFRNISELQSFRRTQLS